MGHCEERTDAAIRPEDPWDSGTWRTIATGPGNDGVRNDLGGTPTEALATTPHSA